MNLLFYATDLGTLAGKFASILPATPAAKPRKDPAVVARARYAGADDRPRDWDAAATCWQQFAPYVKHVTGCEMKEADPVALGRGDLKGVHVLHVTGQGPLRLTGDERAALKRFAAGGGMILVDAYAGSRAFAESARRQLEAVFGKLAPLADDSLLAEGRFLGGVDLTRGVRFKLPARRLLRKRGQAARGQKLLVARVRNRPAVIFSEFDLCSAMAGIESYRSLGYKPASARKIVGNLLAYATAD
jgi:hypothetical protein